MYVFNKLVRSTLWRTPTLEEAASIQSGTSRLGNSSRLPALQHRDASAVGKKEFHQVAEMIEQKLDDSELD